jgi:ABC-type multidrug transport system ATPase subunit
MEHSMDSQSKIGGLRLTWDNLHYEIGGKNPRKILLGAAGSAEPGQLVALLGPSGSGKTSLLNALAGRMPISKGASLVGDIRLNNVPLSQLPCPLADLIGYVEQEDALFALSTVRETLDFGAQLRLPAGVSAEERAARINEVAKKLALVPCLDTLVGGTSFNGVIRGISGGERKRVCIGMELLARPSLLFLDEPTSGLDSCQAYSVIANLKALAEQGHTVVCSIHQPRSAIYGLFDQLVLLSGGNAIYSGLREGAEPHFATLGHDLPAKYNPADFFIDLVSLDYTNADVTKEGQDRVAKLVAGWTNNSPDTSIVMRKTLMESRREAPAGMTTYFRPLALHVARTWREQLRDKVAFLLKIFFISFFTAIFGAVYFRLDKEQTGIQDRTGLLFFLSMNQAFGAVITCAQIIPRQLAVVNRERAARLYKVLPFYIACFIVSLPVEALPQIASNAVIYYMAGMRGNFFIFFVTLFLENMTGISLGMVLSACFKNVTMAPQVAPMVVILFLIFSGFLINSGSVPVYFIWLREISFIRYAFRALIVNEFQDVTFDCADAADAVGAFVEAGPPCVPTGMDVLEQLGFGGRTSSSRACPSSSG